MAFVFHEQPNLAYDAHTAIQGIYSGETVAAWIGDVLGRYGDGIDTEAFLDNCEGLVGLEREVAAAIDLTDERAELLYRKREHMNPPDGAFYHLRLAREYGVEPYKGRLILNGVDQSFEDDTHEVENEADFLRHVEAMNADMLDKLDLMRLYLDFDAYAEFSARNAAAAEAVVRRRLPDFARRLRETVAELRSDMPDMLEKMGLTIDDGEEYAVYPSLLSPSGVGITVIRSDYSVSDICVGVGLGRTVAILDDARARQDIPPDFLKILADPTKMSILRKLNERRCYSAELAEALGLSTATISHHMAAMAGKSFVTIEKEGNRVYYSLRKDTIRDGLRRVERLFSDN